MHRNMEFAYSTVLYQNFTGVSSDTTTVPLQEMTTISLDDEAKNYAAYRIGMAINTYLAPIIFIVGIFGNTLSLIVMLEDHNRRLSCCIYLAGLAISDIISLISLGILWVTIVPAGPIGGTAACKTTAFFFQSGGTSSTCTIVAVTVDRFMATCLPLKTMGMRTWKRALIAEICIFIMSFTFCIPFLFTSAFKTKTICTAFGKSQDVGQEFYSLFLVVFFSLIPFCVILVMNIAIIKRISKLELGKRRPGQTGTANNFNVPSAQEGNVVSEYNSDSPRVVFSIGPSEANVTMEVNLSNTSTHTESLQLSTSSAKGYENEDGQNRIETQTSICRQQAECSLNNVSSNHVAWNGHLCHVETDIDNKHVNRDNDSEQDVTRLETDNEVTRSADHSAGLGLLTGNGQVPYSHLDIGAPKQVLGNGHIANGCAEMNGESSFSVGKGELLPVVSDIHMSSWQGQSPETSILDESTPIKQQNNSKMVVSLSDIHVNTCQGLSPETSILEDSTQTKQQNNLPTNTLPAFEGSLPQIIISTDSQEVSSTGEESSKAIQQDSDMHVNMCQGLSPETSILVESTQMKQQNNSLTNTLPAFEGSLPQIIISTDSQEGSSTGEESSKAIQQDSSSHRYAIVNNLASPQIVITSDSQASITDPESEEDTTQESADPDSDHVADPTPLCHIPKTVSMTVGDDNTVASKTRTRTATSHSNSEQLSSGDSSNQLESSSLNSSGNTRRRDQVAGSLSSLSVPQTAEGAGERRGSWLKMAILQRFRSRSNSEARRLEKQLSKVLLMVSLAFLILTLPQYIRYAVYSFLDPVSSTATYATYVLMYHVSQKLYMTNSAVNFFLYCIGTKRFRHDAKRLICRWRRKGESEC